MNAYETLSEAEGRHLGMGKRRACLCPRHRDDEQRHTSPGAARVFERAAPPVLKCGQRDKYLTSFDDFRTVYLFGLLINA